ncbi:M60 family metallopeptidase [Pseudomonas sp. p1(2021b)]|uniref:M60 family metallopeptidase n=1 Tax=Pseudomonas sp. p1(2021b) TaxID=2874628 RepID=UPI001CCF19A6|nr:M60 family metallopeptidase [Pseudomonas sp. p1(2021b)]UBM24948.1 M60 family metallopeptidase [Pseudomonas sp. p1(2021b)]
MNTFTPSPKFNKTESSTGITTATPVITSLSLRRGAKNDVRGSTSVTQGVIEAFSNGTWKGIADVKADGRFHNPDLPDSYLLTADTVHVRVNSSGLSHPVTATDSFVHPRSIYIGPTAAKANDQAFYQWSLQWADYQPTGYKLPAGKSASLWLEGDDEDVTVLIGVQGLAEQSNRAIQTPNMREVRLQRGDNRLQPDLVGGVIHIRNTGKSGCRVILDGAFQPIPYFILGQTPPNDWHRMLDKSDRQTEVQLVGDRVVISAYADTYRLFAHPDVGEIVRSHEEVLKIEAIAAGLDGSSPRHTRSNLWIHAVESVSSSSPYATTGYIGLPHSRTQGSEYMDALLGGRAHKLWVTLHEYGHHFQNRTNTLAPLFDENSVNIYALAVGRVHSNNYSEEFPKRWPSLKAWLAKPRDQKHYPESPDTHAIFEQLRKGFGDHYLPTWDRFARENPINGNDLVNFTTSLCKVANCNLADFFADWGVIKEGDATWHALHALRLPAAPAGLIHQVPYT